MENRNRWTEKVLFFLLGILFIVTALFLTGANNHQSFGRYQISAWTRGQFVGAMIVDTVTGNVKYVDQKNENKPFNEIK